MTHLKQTQRLNVQFVDRFLKQTPKVFNALHAKKKYIKCVIKETAITMGNFVVIKAEMRKSFTVICVHKKIKRLFVQSAYKSDLNKS